MIFRILFKGRNVTENGRGFDSRACPESINSCPDLGAGSRAVRAGDGPQPGVGAVCFSNIFTVSAIAQARGSRRGSSDRR